MMKSVDGGQSAEALSTVVSMINYIKRRPVESRIFEQLCEAMGTEHMTLLLRTEIRWLSRGKALHHIVELQDQQLLFFEDEKPEYSKHFEYNFWCAKLTCLAEIFKKLTTLNESMQGKEEIPISVSNKITGFYKKLAFWQSSIENGQFSCFPGAESFANQIGANESVSPRNDERTFVCSTNINKGFFPYFHCRSGMGNFTVWYIR
jgi:hypothetical protein